MPIIWGSHVGKQSTFLATLEKAHQLGMSAMQVFPHSPKDLFYRGQQPTEDCLAFAERNKQLGLITMFHAPYLVNLLTPKPSFFNACRKSLVSTLRMAQLMGMDYVVFHPGAYTKESDMGSGKVRLQAGLNLVIKEARLTTTKLLLECHAGGGTGFGGNLIDLASMIDSVDADVKPHLGICLDTAHSYAAGYDFSQPGVIADVVKIVRPYLDVVHFNNPDPQVRLGGHLDRHRVSFNDGSLPVAVMRDLFEALKDKPLIMELNSEEERVGDALTPLETNMAVMRGWISDLVAI